MPGTSAPMSRSRCNPCPITNSGAAPADYAPDAYRSSDHDPGDTDLALDDSAA